MTKVDYTLSGCANGHPVRIVGRGTAGRGRLQLAFTAAEPALAFDASFAHLAGLDALAALALGLAASDETLVVARCRADVLAEGNAEVGTIAVYAAMPRRRGGHRCEAQFAEARLALEPAERLATVGERELRAVSVPGGVAVFSCTRVETSRGREWTVLSTALLFGCEMGLDAVTLPGTQLRLHGRRVRGRQAVRG